MRRSTVVLDRDVCFLGRFLPKLGGTLGCRLFFPEPRSTAASRRGAGSTPANPWRRYTGDARPVRSPVKPVDTIAMPTIHGNGTRGPILLGAILIALPDRVLHLHRAEGTAARSRIYLFIAIGRISKCPRPTPDCSRQNVGNKHLVAAVLHEEMEQEPDWYN